MTAPSGSSLSVATRFPAGGAIQGLNVAWASTTTLTVSAGRALDSTGVKNIFLDSAVTINTANVGVVNGLDTGSLANSTWYYVHVIGNSVDPTVQGALVSASATAPVLPTGYDMFKLIDYQRTNGSAQFLKNYNAGNYGFRTKFWDAAIAVLTSGTATSLTAVDLDGAVPPVDNTPVLLDVAFTPATANDKVSFAPFGSTATTLPNISGVVAAKIQTGQLKVLSKLSTTAKVLYINSAASGNSDAQVSAFEYML